MAYFQPLEYSPFSHSRATTPQYDSYEGGYRMPSGNYVSNLNQWNQEQSQSQQGAYQDYSGQQFQSLFDAVNDLGRSPAMSGEMFNNAPSYSPYGGTRADFTTGGNPITASRMVDDLHGGFEPQRYQTTSPVVFDQRGYLDAQFGNMNDYLSKLGSYFGNMGSPQSASAQQILANAPAQGPRPVMPSVGNSSLNIAGGGTTSANNPFQSFGVKSGGWGTAPTSLFGAGAGNANNP